MRLHAHETSTIRPDGHRGPSWEARFCCGQAMPRDRALAPSLFAVFVLIARLLSGRFRDTGPIREFDATKRLRLRTVSDYAQPVAYLGKSRRVAELIVATNEDQAKPGPIRLWREGRGKMGLVLVTRTAELPRCGRSGEPEPRRLCTHSRRHAVAAENCPQRREADRRSSAN